MYQCISEYPQRTIAPTTVKVTHQRVPHPLLVQNKLRLINTVSAWFALSTSVPLLFMRVMVRTDICLFKPVSENFNILAFWGLLRSELQLPKVSYIEQWTTADPRSFFFSYPPFFDHLLNAGHFRRAWKARNLPTHSPRDLTIMGPGIIVSWV